MTYMVGGYLLGLSVEDIRRKELPMWILLVGCVGSVFYSIICKGLIWAVSGVLPGISLLILAVILPDSVGTGDGILAVAYGLLYGWRHVCIWLILSFLLAAVFGVVLRSFHRGRSDRLPFVPFLTLVHLGLCI